MINSLHPYFPNQEAYSTAAASWENLLIFMVDKHFSRFTSSMEPQDFGRLAQISRFFRAHVENAWSSTENDTYPNRLWAAKIYIKSNMSSSDLVTILSQTVMPQSLISEERLGTMSEMLFQESLESSARIYSLLEIKTMYIFSLSSIGKSIAKKTPLFVMDSQSVIQEKCVKTIQTWLEEDKKKATDQLASELKVIPPPLCGKIMSLF